MFDFPSPAPFLINTEALGGTRVVELMAERGWQARMMMSYSATIAFNASNTAGEVEVYRAIYVKYAEQREILWEVAIGKFPDAPEVVTRGEAATLDEAFDAVVQAAVDQEIEYAAKARAKLG